MSKAPNADWLERANRLALTSALLSTTVHEVNNALQVISGSAEMLNASPPADVTGRRTDAIGAHARRASALLAELSSFARAKHGADGPRPRANQPARAVVAAVLAPS
jgi:signal transduction histidine kinase